MLSQPLAPLGSPTPRLQERLHLPPVTPHSRHLGDRSHPVSPAPSPPPPLELQKGERTSPRPYLSPQLREAEHSIDYLCHKFEALSRQLSREEQAREAAEKRGRQLAAESLEAQKYKEESADALISELTSRQAAIASLREKAGLAAQNAAQQAYCLREEQAAGAAAEQRCQSLHEECRQISERYDQAVQRLALEDREIARARFEAQSSSRRLRQTEADMQVVREDLRIEAQRQLLAQQELHRLEQLVEATMQEFWMVEQEVERQEQVLGQRHQGIKEEDAELLALKDSVREVQAEMLRFTRQLAHVDDECGQLECQLNDARQALLAAGEEVTARRSDLKAQREAGNSLRSELLGLEAGRLSKEQEVEACRRRIQEVEAAISECKDHSVKAFREKEVWIRKVEELKAEDAQLSAVCSGLRRAAHAGALATEDVQSELQVAFRRREALVEETTANRKASAAFAVQLQQLRPEIAEADERCARLEASLVQKSKDLEDELLRKRSLQQDLDLVTEALWEQRSMGKSVEQAMSPKASPLNGAIRVSPSPASPATLRSPGSGSVPLRRLR
ncbi:unnamed protein product [Symbiodinium sp. CCMP2456]|nr:unnamed protein product [Symbiodinium sp. CCMP2456]